MDDNWDGDAADAYRQTLPVQKNALDKVKTSLTDGISTALADVAEGIVVFWASATVALAALVAGIVAAIVSSATIVGLPAAPLIAAAAVSAACVAVITGGMLLKSRCSKASTTLRQRLDDYSAFPEGHWPPAARY